MNKHLPRFMQHPLAREIALAIAIKLVVLTGLFFAFFDGRAVHPDADAVAERLARPHHHATH